MTSRSVDALPCPRCRREVALPASACPYCGDALPPGNLSAASHPSFGRPGASWRQMIDQPWVVLLLLFGVMGPLAIPVLWKSRGFSAWAKLGLSIAVIVYIAALGAAAWWAVTLAWEAIRRATL